MNQNSSLEGLNPTCVSPALTLKTNVSKGLIVSKVSKTSGIAIRSLARNSCRKPLAIAHRFVLLCAFSLMSLSPLHVYAQSETPAVLKQLTDFTETLKSFSADFTQVVYDADSNPRCRLQSCSAISRRCCA